MDHFEGWKKAEMDLRDVSECENGTYDCLGIAILISLNSIAWGVIGYLAGVLL